MKSKMPDVQYSEVTNYACLLPPLTQHPGPLLPAQVKLLEEGDQQVEQVVS